MGLACLFYKVCDEKNCIVFRGPVIRDIDEKVFEFDNECYKYKLKHSTCDAKLKTVPISSSNSTADDGSRIWKFM